LSQHSDVDLRIIAFGPHLSPEFGNTVREIERDGFTIAARIECLLSSDSDIGMAKTIGLACLGGMTKPADAFSSYYYGDMYSRREIGAGLATLPTSHRARSFISQLPLRVKRALRRTY